MAADHRLAALQGWLEGTLGLDLQGLEPASSDASFRRYFRVRLPEGTAIAMDAPPEREDCRPFLRVADLLREAGLNPPAVLGRDLAQGFLLLSDLGRETYLDVLDPACADALFADAIEALVRWQAASRPGVLPPYDEALLRRELDIFTEWYVGRHLGQPLGARDAAVWQGACDALVDRALAQPRVFVHRDYIPRNLMAAPPRPGVVDFQDAVLGPVGYDIMTLLRDAFVSWDAADERRWLCDYRQRAVAAGVPVPADAAALQADVDWLATQRHLKVIGIFARLHHRDGKSRYLAEIPRFFAYLRHETAGHEALRPLAALLERLADGGAR